MIGTSWSPAGDPEPRGWVPGLPRNVQGAQTQEGAEIQDGAGGLISHGEKMLSNVYWNKAEAKIQQIVCI